jgi:hypothetical protein
MKRLSLLLISILMIIFWDINITYGSTSLKNDECWCNLNKRILEDIKRSFPELIVLQNYGKVTKYDYHDLYKAGIIEGRETQHIKSLKPLFAGANQGDRHLYIVSGEKELPPKYNNSFVGYMLYKQIDGKNVMIKLRRSDSAWDVVSKQEVAAKRVLPTKECLNRISQ